VKWRIAIVAALGLGLALYLVCHVGVGLVLSAATHVGWRGFAALCVYALSTQPILAAGWRTLLPPGCEASYGVLLWARMIREAASDVLPFSQLGGIVLGARAAIVHRTAPSLAFASIIADVTAELLAQVAFIALGLAILLTHLPHTPFAASLGRYFLLGLALAISAGAVLLALQRYGHRLTFRLAARLLPRSVAHAAAVADALDAIYAEPARVALSCAIHLGAWIASAVGTLIAFRLMGAHVDFLTVIAVESFVSGVRSIAVLVPNGLGIQEATYTVLAPLLGVGAPLGLAVSLLKRARDIALGVPVLLISQAAEGRRVLGRGDLTDPQ